MSRMNGKKKKTHTHITENWVDVEQCCFCNTHRKVLVILHCCFCNMTTHRKVLVILHNKRFSIFFFFLISSLTADGLHHYYYPACGHPSLPGSRLTIFYRDACSAFLQLVDQWLNFTSYTLTFPCIPLRNRTHDFRTRRCAGYLLGNSGDEGWQTIKLY